MNYGSVCSGIEAATLAWKPLGWEAKFVAEVEPFPSAVLCERWNATRPKRPLDPTEATSKKEANKITAWRKATQKLPEVGTLPNLGDFTKMQKDDYEGKIDLLVGGTPCQSFSIAGLRKGLADPRGNLCLEFAKLAYRTDVRLVVWENVPGVLSSNGGNDFAGFLSLLCGWEVGVPKGGWKRCGIVTNAPGCFGLAWRILDAQYTRVSQFPRAIPQRRRRIVLVGHLDSWRYPAKVLFDGEMCGGDTPPRRTKRQETANDVERSTNETKSIRVRCGKDGGGKGALVGTELSHTLATGNDQTIVTFTETDIEPECFDMRKAETHSRGLSPTLVATDCFGGKAICYENHLLAARIKETEVAPVLLRSAGIGVDDIPLVQEVESTDSMPTITATFSHAVGFQSTVRKLLPVECERLMGMPDGYTQIPWRGKVAEECPDSLRYKALGNSMCVNFMMWIGERIQQVENEYGNGKGRAEPTSGETKVD